MLGAVLHFGIACTWSALFAVAARYWGPLSRLLTRPKGPVIAGFAYGGLVWLAMDLIVLLGRAPTAPVMSWVFAANFERQTAMIGLPIALIVGRAAQRSGRALVPTASGATVHVRRRAR